MGARGKKRRRADGSVAHRMTESEVDLAIERENLRSLREIGPPLLVRLAEIGVDLEELRDVPRTMARVYDANRRPKGSQTGAFGPSGLRIYERLTELDYFEPDWTIFSTSRPFSIADLVTDTGYRSVQPVRNGLQGLIEHGFVECVPEGRTLRLRPLLPEAALPEAAWHHVKCAEMYLAQSWRDTDQLALKQIRLWKAVAKAFGSEEPTTK